MARFDSIRVWLEDRKNLAILSLTWSSAFCSSCWCSTGRGWDAICMGIVEPPEAGLFLSPEIGTHRLVVVDSKGRMDAFTYEVH